MPSRSTLLSSFSALSIVVMMGAGCTGGGHPPTSAPVDPTTAIFGDPTPGATSPSPTPPAALSCSHEYYPLRAGYEMHYQTHYPPARDTSGVGGYSVRVTDVRSNVAKLHVTFDGSGTTGDINSDLEYRCLGGSLYALAYVDMGSRVRGGAAANKFQVTTDHAEGEFLPRTIAVGSVWTSKFDLTIHPEEVVEGSPIRTPLSMHVQIERGAVAEETVRVAAGEYKAMKVRTITTIDGHEAIDGFEWWVKDIGMVKSAFDAGSGTPDILTEATSVHVPSL